jgi:putative hydrolase of the HAD superfamily
MNELSNIRNIIFDLGNVLLPLDFPKLMAAFKEVAGNGQEVPFKTLITNETFLQYETGFITTPQFLVFLKGYIRSSATHQELTSAWNSLIGGFPEEHVFLLKELGKKYRLFLLSNTNALHVQYFEGSVPGVLNLSDLFERVYYSNEEGLRKPQKELFQRVLQQNNLEATQTLYVDDLLENCQAASSLGYKTLHVTPALNLANWFTSRTKD